jgi:hypothetical protein
VALSVEEPVRLVYCRMAIGKERQRIKGKKIKQVRLLEIVK